MTTDTPDVKTNAPAGALSTMVLPELRALANQAGVKGTSGMRKNELIAAIREIRGQANGASAPAAPEDSGKSDTATAEAPAEADAPAPQGEQNGFTTEAPRRERRGASREVGISPAHGRWGAIARIRAGRGARRPHRDADGQQDSQSGRAAPRRR